MRCCSGLVTLVFVFFLIALVAAVVLRQEQKEKGQHVRGVLGVSCPIPQYLQVFDSIRSQHAHRGLSVQTP